MNEEQNNHKPKPLCEIDGVPIVVKFDHVRQEVPAEDPVTKQIVIVKGRVLYTNCHILIGEFHTVAYANLNPCDTFDRAFGRKLSFTRALRLSRIHRTRREQIWKALLEKDPALRRVHFPRGLK